LFRYTGVQKDTVRLLTYLQTFSRKCYDKQDSFAKIINTFVAELTSQSCQLWI